MSRLKINLHEATDAPKFNQDELDAFKDVFDRLGILASISSKVIHARFRPRNVVIYFIPWIGPKGDNGVRIDIVPPWDFVNIMNNTSVTCTCRYSDNGSSLSESIDSIVTDSIPVVKNVCNVIDALCDLSPTELQ